MRAVRERHDGARRNPWNDIECGSYYARSMSSYALVNAWLGLSFDQRRGEIGFAPGARGRRDLFWSAGRGWGEIAFRGDGATLSVKGGELAVSALRLPTLPGRATVDGRPASATATRSSRRDAQLTPGIVSSWSGRAVARIELKSVRKSFQTVEVIHGIDLTIEDGAFTVFVGPSGCGKSTLLRMMAGLEEVSAGEIAIDGVALRPSAAGGARHGDGVPVLRALSAHERRARTCASASRTRACRSRRSTARVARAADILQIAHLLKRRPIQLSGGQSQRVAIGRAIVKEPKAFLFDEPLSNLDAELRVKMRGEMVALHRRLGSTMIYVTHDQVEAMTMADKIVVLREGIVEQVGPPVELYARPRNRFVAGFLGAPQMNILSATVQAASPSGLRLAVDQGRGAIEASVAGGQASAGEAPRRRHPPRTSLARRGGPARQDRGERDSRRRDDRPRQTGIRRAPGRFAARHPSRRRGRTDRLRGRAPVRACVRSRRRRARAAARLGRGLRRRSIGGEARGARVTLLAEPSERCFSSDSCATADR